MQFGGKVLDALALRGAQVYAAPSRGGVDGLQSRHGGEGGCGFGVGGFVFVVVLYFELAPVVVGVVDEGYFYFFAGGVIGGGSGVGGVAGGVGVVGLFGHGWIWWAWLERGGSGGDQCRDGRRRPLDVWMAVD